MEEISILIIEDDEKLVQELEGILKNLGYKVWVANNPQEGLNLLKATTFACILTELRMPYMNGVELTRQVMRISPSTNVIVITPYNFISSAVEAMEEGAYGYITKPFNVSEIRVILERAVERHFLISKEREEGYYMRLSIVDPLTGIYNRRCLIIQMKNKVNTLKRQRYQKFSLLMIDIDDFKKYNDTKGHLEGDKLLKEMAKLFQDSAREKDTVFRYGGEEFVIFLEDTDKKGASIVAERIRSLINLYTPTTISIGVSTFPDDGDTEEELISKADKALYEAKRGGKNKVCLA